LHESPATITIPLMILAVLSALGGFLGLPEIFGDHSWISAYLNPVFSANPGIIHYESTSVEWNIIFVSITAFIVIIYFANQYYNRRKVAVDIDASKANMFYRLSYHKFYVDELYNYVIVKPLEAMGDFFGTVVEHTIIDGIVNGLGALSLYLASQFRKLQTGNIGFYVFAMVIAIIVILIFGLGKMNAF
jgi:NADH-quinone oxidoreductase subunit L